MRAGSATTVTFEPSGILEAVRGPQVGLYNQLVGERAEGPVVRAFSADLVRPQASVPEDLLHSLSVICGYAGLVAGFAGAAALLAW